VSLNRDILLVLKIAILFNLVVLNIFIPNSDIYNILYIIYIKFWFVNIAIDSFILICLFSILPQRTVCFVGF